MMNPLGYWAAIHTELLDHSTDDERLRHQRLLHADELAPLERDGRWAAAIRRWSEQDQLAADATQSATRVRGSCRTGKLTDEAM